MLFCTECGTNVPEGMKFCPSCGKAMAAESPDVQPPPVYARQQQAYSQPAPAVPPPEGQYAVVSVLGWLGTLIVFAIPIVGQIFCILWAFGNGNHNRRNLSRACLILAIAGIVLGVVFCIVFSAAIAAMLHNATGAYAG